MCDTQKRGFFCIIDGIIGGEKDGPLAPDPVGAGILVAGHNPLAVDAVATTLMGFEIEKIPVIKKALKHKDYINPVFSGTKEDIKVIDRGKIFNLYELKRNYNLKFEPHPNWKGHVELD